MNIRPLAFAIVVVLAGCASAQSSSPQPSAEQTPEPSASAAASLGGVASSSPTSAPADTPSPQPGGLAEVATFEASGAPPTLLTTWGEGFVALAVNAVWISPDGTTWPRSETEGIDGVVVHLVERGDGSLLAFGYTADRAGESRAWSSADGANWAPVSGLPPVLVWVDVARGERGYVLVGRASSGHEELWYSPDAVSWELVRDGRDDEFIATIGAGPEGFVAVGQQGFATGPTTHALILASSDGRSWFEAPADGLLGEVGSLWTIAPLGGDWLTSPLTVGTEVPLLWSADGLRWEQRASIPVDRAETGAILSLFSSGSRLFGYLADGGDRDLNWGPAIRTSRDGVEWMPTDLVRRAPLVFATADGVSVLVTGGKAYIHRE